MATMEEWDELVAGFEYAPVPLSTRPPIPIVIKFLEDTEVDRTHSQWDSPLPNACSKSYATDVVDVKHIVDDAVVEDIKSVYELTLRIKNETVSYSPGDTIGILPRNPDSTITSVFNQCSIVLKQKFNKPILLEISEDTLKLEAEKETAPRARFKIPAHLPRTPTTLQKIFEEVVELNYVPKKSFFNACVLHGLLSNPRERWIFSLLGSRAGATLYTDHILRRQRTCLHFLNTFRSWLIGPEQIGVLLESTPRLLPRPYSIASSMLTMQPEHEKDTTILRIVFAVHKPPGIVSTMLRGVCQRFIDKKLLQLTPHVELYFRQSTHFKLTDVDLNIPIIMVAIGTGIAPFIGFLEHIQEQNKSKFPATQNPKRLTWLFFGSPYKAKQMYAERLKEFHANGILNEYDECFSRDANEPNSLYVQDAIRSKAKKLFECYLGDPNAVGKMFVCGGKKMQSDVRDAVMESLVTAGMFPGWDAAGAKLKSLMAEFRYVEDTWLSA